MTTPTTVEAVVERMRAIDEALPATDGVSVFNHVYLTVTEQILGLLSAGGSTFHDDAFLADLDIRFANLWLEAYDAAAAGAAIPKAWAPLFDCRAERRLPIQFALAGMNTHIEHDLPVALWRTCEARGMDLERREVREDYEQVNDVLAEVEAGIRRSFLTSVGRAVDDEVGPVAHLVSAWNIDKARDIAWVSAQTIWTLRHTSLLLPGFLRSLASSVGMTSRVLLTPLPRP